MAHGYPARHRSQGAKAQHQSVVGGDVLGRLVEDLRRDDARFAAGSHRTVDGRLAADRWFPSAKTCSGCGAMSDKSLLHVRTYPCDARGLVIDRDSTTARHLTALATACTTRTGVGGGQDTPAVSKPRGAGQKTRATCPSRKARAGRASGRAVSKSR
ncbi:hypothetical protein LK07_20660 [Streptomyces pluripotens]|uniref:Transposase n=1 Tax=Streptomyces pluripotens TaxID=1355015 RepID=A0A221P1T7_9ACTN|nr:transposase [Streptomyces pluripotens]ARP71766.1 hypothetical protein LK06_019495 [Streptomyces pluripotens]ASN26018.1 hypothetical protein LK07_20660 [Streptomyces pluripotens]